MRHKITVSVIIVIGSVLFAFSPRALAAEPAFSVGTVPGTSAVPLSIIQQLQLDKKYKLNMEIRQFGDFDAIDDAYALKRITMNTGESVLVGGTHKIKSGYGLAIFPAFKATNKLLVRADSPVRSLADLRGKRIAVISTTGGEFPVLKWIMKTDHGMDIMKDVDPRPVAPPLALQLLTQGDVAASLLFEPFASRAMFGGKARVLLHVGQEWQKRKGQPLWFSAIHVDDSFARANPDTIKRFLRAYSEAVDYINKNPREVYQRYKDAFKITDEADFELLLKNFSDIFTTKWDDQVIGSIKEYMRILVEEKLMSRVPDELFSKDFAP